MTSACSKGVPAKVSICVVAYNQERFIGECLQSLVDQRTALAFEIIVGDDFSRDGTRRIIMDFAAKYPQIVKPILHERNLGMAQNYLSVHRAASGELVCHCDGDDFWEPYKIDRQVRFLEEHPECSAVFSNSYVISTIGNRIGVFSRHVPPTFDTAYLIRDGNFLHHSSMMYRRRFQETMFPRASEFIDFHVYVLLSRVGRLGYIDEFCTSYRSQSSASVIQQDNQRIRRLVWQALAEVTAADAPPCAIRRAHAKFLADAAYHVLRSGQPLRYVDWRALVRQSTSSRLVTTEIRALCILARVISRSIFFNLAVRFGFRDHDVRVFYPRGAKR